jgi:hypothetical protein
VRERALLVAAVRVPDDDVLRPRATCDEQEDEK